MAKQVAIGIQNFEKLIKGGYYYIDKTKFIKEWWDSGDVSGYMYDTKEYLSAEPGIAAGDVLTNHDRMVKLGETALTITATRKAHESNSSKECLTD